jgi:hypothetical protein
MCGRLRVGKDFLHAASLVGAAISVEVQNLRFEHPQLGAERPKARARNLGQPFVMSFLFYLFAFFTRRAFIRSCSFAPTIELGDRDRCGAHRINQFAETVFCVTEVNLRMRAPRGGG